MRDFDVDLKTLGLFRGGWKRYIWRWSNDDLAMTFGHVMNVLDVTAWFSYATCWWGGVRRFLILSGGWCVIRQGRCMENGGRRCLCCKLFLLDLNSKEWHACVAYMVQIMQHQISACLPDPKNSPFFLMLDSYGRNIVESFPQAVDLLEPDEYGWTILAVWFCVDQGVKVWDDFQNFAFFWCHESEALEGRPNEREWVEMGAERCRGQWAWACWLGHVSRGCPQKIQSYKNVRDLQTDGHVNLESDNLQEETASPIINSNRRAAAAWLLAV